MKRNNTRTFAPAALCSNITATGRRCRFRVHHPDSPFCRSHARIHTQAERKSNRAANPLANLPSELTNFTTIADVTRFQASVLVLLSENRISPRRAAVLSYIANSILNGLRFTQQQARLASLDVAREARLLAKDQPDDVSIDWTGVPRPSREFHREHDEPLEIPSVCHNQTHAARSADNLLGAPCNPLQAPSVNQDEILVTCSTATPACPDDGRGCAQRSPLHNSCIRHDQNAISAAPANPQVPDSVPAANENSSPAPTPTDKYLSYWDQRKAADRKPS